MLKEEGKMRKLLLTISAVTVSSIMLTGCEVGPDYEPPKLDMPKLRDKEEMSIFKSQQ